MSNIRAFKIGDFVRIYEAIFYNSNYNKTVFPKYRLTSSDIFKINSLTELLSATLIDIKSGRILEWDDGGYAYFPTATVLKHVTTNDIAKMRIKNV